MESKSIIIKKKKTVQILYLIVSLLGTLFFLGVSLISFYKIIFVKFKFVDFAIGFVLFFSCIVFYQIIVVSYQENFFK